MWRLGCYDFRSIPCQKNKPKGKNVLPSTDLLDSSSDATLLQFLSKWAAGGLEPTSDSTSQPAALSTLCELEALGDSSPAFDLDPDNDTPEVPKPGNQVNRYVMLSLLGEGGMGEVFLAFDQDLRRHVALKSVRDGVDERQLWRFLKEAQVLAQLGHPNIVTVYEMGVTKEKLPYYTMPVVQGSTLHHILQLIKGKDPGTLRSFSMTRLMQVFLQVALALEYAHYKGVVHRDIKPANIMIGEHGEVLLLDWGVAKLMGETELETEACADITQSGPPRSEHRSICRPSKSPAAPWTKRSDVYALGTLLYEMLTLEPPFRGSLVGVIESAHLNDAPKAPRALELRNATSRSNSKKRACARSPNLRWIVTSRRGSFTTRSRLGSKRRRTKRSASSARESSQARERRCSTTITRSESRSQTPTDRSRTCDSVSTLGNPSMRRG